MEILQSLFKKVKPTPLFTPNELAAYDIPDTKKSQYKNFIPTLFGEFQSEYKILCDKRKTQISNLVKPNMDNEDLKKIRKKINVLIIIGSSISNQIIKTSNLDYQKSTEDLSMALLIRHLFHYSFGISYDQILITSTQNSDFSLININKEELISKPENIFNGIHDTDPISESFLYHILNEKEFMLEQNINLVQIKNQQYKFYIDESIKNIVKPFNINVILKKLPKNPDSDLFVFLLDHEHEQGFGDLPYQFIIERLLKIKCKHFFVFNDSHRSGSIIKIIDICMKFKKIFPEIENNPILESALFYFITNLNKVYSNDEQIAVSISEKLYEIDSYNINDEMKNVLKSMILKIDKPMLTKISEFVFDLGDEFKSFGCVPQQIIQFSEKATIFTSSDFDQLSLTLPGRKLNISILNESTIRVFGSIFSSILVESFFNMDGNTSLDKFRDLIYNKYEEYGNEFKKYINEQNQNIENETFNTELPKEDQIEKFFSPKNYKTTHYFTKHNEFPELQTILLENKYWNLDITKVNSSEYNDVHFCSMKNKINQKNLGPLTLEQLAQYDIPNANERKRKNHCNTIKLLFNQFSDKYQTLFCRRAKVNKEAIAFNLDNQKLANIRKNISILIIINTKINLQTSKYFNGKYQKNAEDLDIALFIRHLFHYAFGIPKEQILITSTQVRDFTNKQYSNSAAQNNQNDHVYFNIMNQDGFMLYQHINLAQIGNFQYKFYLDEDIKDIVKPFNKDIIKSKLIINDNSDIFVFYLDHGYAEGFDSIPYKNIIECILGINCKHFFMFNDSNYSGALIKLINICGKFREIFPDIKDQNDETNFFYFLMDFDKVSPKDFKSEIYAKVNSSNLNENTKEYINTILDSANLNKIIEYLSNIDDSLKSIECIPQQIIQFSEKATIFASSDFDQLSLTLPGRKLDISILNESTIRVFGSIFSSILVESFLNMDRNTSLDIFRDLIYNKYEEYGNEFKKYINEQNQNIENETFNTELPKEDQIEKFFSPKNYKTTHYFTKHNEFPDLQTILLENKYWNLDITKVNSSEYNDVHFCIFKKYHSKYGPTWGSYYIDKFMEDFKDAVDLLFKENKIQKEFAIDNFSQENEDMVRNNCPLYGQFISLIRKSIKSSNYQAIRLLKIPIAIFYEKNPEDYEKNAEILAESFNKIIPFWEDYYLQY